MKSELFESSFSKWIVDFFLFDVCKYSRKTNDRSGLCMSYLFVSLFSGISTLSFVRICVYLSMSCIRNWSVFFLWKLCVFCTYLSNERNQRFLCHCLLFSFSFEFLVTLQELWCWFVFFEINIGSKSKACFERVLRSFVRSLNCCSSIVD